MDSERHVSFLSIIFVHQKLVLCVLAADLVPSATDVQWHDLSNRTASIINVRPLRVGMCFMSTFSGSLCFDLRHSRTFHFFFLFFNVFFVFGGAGSASRVHLGHHLPALPPALLPRL